MSNMDNVGNRSDLAFFDIELGDEAQDQQFSQPVVGQANGRMFLMIDATGDHRLMMQTAEQNQRATAQDI